MRSLGLIIILLSFMAGCSTYSPVLPDSNDVHPGLARETQSGAHMLWQRSRFYFNEARDRVDVIPQRMGDIHLNALKFLEEYCADCVEIVSVQNNGDSTVDLTVRITHPFANLPEYTGFDVKGIIMFNGSYQVNDLNAEYDLGVPDTVTVSWRELGDPEILNPDGYTPRWNPAYDSGSSAPIFNYWPGKYASGTPTAYINAFKNFYTDEARHIFRVNRSVERTYHIYLPPGQPVVAGYAVEACWEPPLNLPVTDPITDFPITANQDEAYHFEYVINNGDPIQVGSDCCGNDSYPELGCSTLRAEFAFWWDVDLSDYDWVTMSFGDVGGASPLYSCDPPIEGSSVAAWLRGDSGGAGIYRGIRILCYQDGLQGTHIAWDVADRIVVD